MLVAEGAIDLAIDAIGLAPYDLAAVMVVVEEAGGTFTDRLGERTYLNDSAISSNGASPCLPRKAVRTRRSPLSCLWA